MKSALKYRNDHVNHGYVRQLFGWTGTIALATALSMGYIWHQVETRSLSREIIQLGHQKETLNKEGAYLHARIVRLAGRLGNETMATNRFELEHAAVGQVVAMEAVDTAMPLSRSGPDVRAIAVDPADDTLILASFSTARMDTR